jgi:hypothetical protein
MSLGFESQPDKKTPKETINRQNIIPALILLVLYNYLYEFRSICGKNICVHNFWFINASFSEHWGLIPRPLGCVS